MMMILLLPLMLMLTDIAFRHALRAAFRDAFFSAGHFF